ncbi:transmembrane protein 116 [Thalassophryne amazonica]|uniref:transmembrane protein 116 n=1 Tax=Thalassophryne amazonica TaxID=390379 RepID=UPI0014717623|nr:transmembrane protein 116 [Thalassophryne amazonica]
MELTGSLSEDHIGILSTVYLVFLTPSVIGSCSVLVVSIIRWKHLQQQVQILVQLALADLLAAVVLMSASAMNKVQNINNVHICQYSLPLSITFYSVSFLLVLVYAWTSKTAIEGWRERPAESNEEQRLIPTGAYFLYVLTFLIKSDLLVLTNDIPLSGAAFDESKYCTSCIFFLHNWSDPYCKTENIHDTFITIVLFLVVIPVMVSCSVIYYKIGKWYQRSKQEGLFPVEGDGRSSRRHKKMFSTARNMVMVIFFSWTPALILIVLSTLTTWPPSAPWIEQNNLFAVYVIQAVAVSLQGFLNSLVYAWRRPNFTEAVLGEATPLMVHEHLAFFDESLRS